jgi:L-alanine-DL-glutamate epimerase-like enolase superfamily enzyme
MIDYAHLGYIQIDAGRIGGVTSAKHVADYARARGTTYVNHTFTSHLALSGSLQAYAGMPDHIISEYPFEPKPLAYELSANHVERDSSGQVCAPDAPGLGIRPDLRAIQRYLQDVEITVQGQMLYRTPTLD